jgi:DmsE family decaheme c-type cytochrome
VETPSKKPVGYALVLILAFFVVFACLAVDRGVMAADTEESPRVSEVCLDCHDGYDASLALTPHQLNSDALDGPEAIVTCADCHAGDARHYEEDAEEFPRTNPAKVGVVAAMTICSTCHMNSHQQTMVEGNVHSDNDISCLNCHSVHASTHDKLLKEAEPSLCLDCHSGVENEFYQPFRHPVNDGIVRCTECHMSLDETRTELSMNGTGMCTQCHGEFQGPFPFEHQAGVDYSTEEGGCLACHSPHGSIQPRMLKQPYEPPHFQLCTQCHSVPPGHNLNPRHGSMWSGLPCTDCHTDIHGSYTSRNFLSESLEGQGCLKSGCHQ